MRLGIGILGQGTHHTFAIGNPNRLSKHRTKRLRQYIIATLGQPRHTAARQRCGMYIHHKHQQTVTWRIARFPLQGVSLNSFGWMSLPLRRSLLAPLLGVLLTAHRPAAANTRARPQHSHYP